MTGTKYIEKRAEVTRPINRPHNKDVDNNKRTYRSHRACGGHSGRMLSGANAKTE